MGLVLPVKDHNYTVKKLQKFVENLFKIYLFGSKKNINYQAKFTLKLPSSYRSFFYS